jgi:predicted metal-dependent hydrolase
MHPKIAEGIRLFNSHKFFEAHEALEEVWLKAEGGRKTFLHGLIQVAAAFHHHTRGNIVGFHSLLGKGLMKLEISGDHAEGIDLLALCKRLHHWRDRHDEGQAEGEERKIMYPHIT